MLDADGVVEQAAGHGRELPGGGGHLPAEIEQGSEDLLQLALGDEQQPLDGVEEDAGVLPDLGGPLTLVLAKGEAELCGKPEPVPLQEVRQLLGVSARLAAVGSAAAPAVVARLQKQQQVVHPRGRIHAPPAGHVSAPGEPAAERGPAREVASELEHENAQRGAGRLLAEVGRGEAGQHPVEVDAGAGLVAGPGAGLRGAAQAGGPPPLAGPVLLDEDHPHPVGAAAAAALGKAVVGVPDVGAYAEVAVPDPANEAGDGGELDRPLSQALVAPARVGDEPPGRVPVLGHDAQGLHDGRRRETGIHRFDDAGVDVAPELEAERAPGRLVVEPRPVVLGARHEDGVRHPGVLHETAEDGASLAGERADQGVPLAAVVEEGAHLEVGRARYAELVDRDANVVRREERGVRAAGPARRDHANAAATGLARRAEARGRAQEGAGPVGKKDGHHRLPQGEGAQHGGAGRPARTSGHEGAAVGGDEAAALEAEGEERLVPCPPGGEGGEEQARGARALGEGRPPGASRGGQGRRAARAIRGGRAREAA